jgi:hypothetical protein
VKRSGPPPRRTPMRRTAFNGPRARIRPVSDKRAGEADAREATRQAVIARDVTCRVGPAIDRYLLEVDAAARRAGRTSIWMDPDVEAFAAQARACRPWQAGDVHEPGGRGRDIGSHLDADRCVLACRPCHDWCHANPRLARLVGGYT